ncbi:hypothetical protein D9619_012839 [Psilocybe cf. subviscida]|uniref:Uncharacterized protein n=1 Tax=Psilocybe cf. subviscida TaxID=2480587 RepID=A0A8H5ARA3_9AGAR|nr:hypothetical protein D9619_012839 [Psilocybe cf. subviscida]
MWKLYRKAANSLRYYSIALALLWISVMLSFAGDWVRSTAGFVWKNRSPSAIYNELDAPLPIVMEVSGFTNVPLGGRTNYLASSLASLSCLITTVSATSLIALKIVLVTKQNRMRRSYAKAVRILVQSAAIVSIVQLGMTVLQLISFFHSYNVHTSTGKFCSYMYDYLGYMQGPAAGIGPTLIAFRVAEEPHRDETETDLINRKSWLSHLLSRSTTSNTITDRQIAGTMAPTICFGSVQDGSSSAQTCMDGEPPEHILTKNEVPESIRSTEYV